MNLWLLNFSLIYFNLICTSFLIFLLFGLKFHDSDNLLEFIWLWDWECISLTICFLVELHVMVGAYWFVSVVVVLGWINFFLSFWVIKLNIILSILLLVLMILASSNVSLSLWMASLVRLQVQLFRFLIDLIILNNFSYNSSNIIFISEFFQNGSNSVELGIFHVVVPADARNGILWLKQEGNRRIIYYNDICHWSAKSR